MQVPIQKEAQGAVLFGILWGHKLIGIHEKSRRQSEYCWVLVFILTSRSMPYLLQTIWHRSCSRLFNQNSASLININLVRFLYM